MIIDFNIKFLKKKIEIARVTDWKTYNVRSHLGEYLEHGVSVLGYDLTTLNFFLEAGDEVKNLPEIVLVKRFYPNKKKRIWKLRRMDIEEKDEKNIHKKNKVKEEHFDDFLEEVENDPDMRQKINLYKVIFNFLNFSLILKKQNEEISKKGKKPKKHDKNKTNPEIKNRKILKVVKNNEKQSAEIIEKPQEEEKNMEDEEEEEENVNPHQVRLEELLDDLRLDDEEDEVEVIKENEGNVEDFVKQMDKVKISKE